MKLSEVFSKELIFLDIPFEGKRELLRFLVEKLVEQGRLPQVEPAFSIVWERESYMTTGIGGGVAIPHGRCFDVQGIVGAFYLSRSGIPFQALDGKDVHFVAFFLSHPEEQLLHLQLLKTLTTTLKKKEVQRLLLKASSEEEVYRVFSQLDHFQRERGDS